MESGDDSDIDANYNPECSSVSSDEYTVKSEYMRRNGLGTLILIYRVILVIKSCYESHIFTELLKNSGHEKLLLQNI